MFQKQTLQTKHCVHKTSLHLLKCIQEDLNVVFFERWRPSVKKSVTGRPSNRQLTEIFNM